MKEELKINIELDQLLDLGDPLERLIAHNEANWELWLEKEFGR